MDNKKLLAGAVLALLAGVVLGRATVADRYSAGRLDGCNKVISVASNGLASCSLVGGELHVLLAGQDVANLDAQPR